MMSADLFDKLKTALADRYRLEGYLGAGGMASVYLAEDVKHHRKTPISSRCMTQVRRMASSISSCPMSRVSLFALV
jgi:hypothetical protein